MNCILPQKKNDFFLIRAIVIFGLLFPQIVFAGDVMHCQWVKQDGDKDTYYCVYKSEYNTTGGSANWDNCAAQTWNSVDECVKFFTPSGTATTQGSGTKSFSTTLPKQSNSPTPSKPSASTPAAQAKPSSPVFGAPTNLGNPKGTPKAGGSIFLPECATTEGQGPGSGCRDVGAFVSLFVNFSNAIFGIIGGVVFLFFVYGGIVWLTSAGNAERVKKGRDVLVGALIGLLIVFGAQMLVKFIIGGLTGQQDTLEVKVGEEAKK